MTQIFCNLEAFFSTKTLSYIRSPVLPCQARSELIRGGERKRFQTSWLHEQLTRMPNTNYTKICIEISPDFVAHKSNISEQFHSIVRAIAKFISVFTSVGKDSPKGLDIKRGRRATLTLLWPDWALIGPFWALYPSARVIFGSQSWQQNQSLRVFKQCAVAQNFSGDKKSGWNNPSCLLRTKYNLSFSKNAIWIHQYSGTVGSPIPHYRFLGVSAKLSMQERLDNKVSSSLAWKPEKKIHRSNSQSKWTD